MLDIGREKTLRHKWAKRLVRRRASSQLDYELVIAASSMLPLRMCFSHCSAEFQNWRNIRSHDVFRVRSLYVGARDHLHSVLFARPLALSVRWILWKAEVAPALAIEAWSWRCYQYVWRAVNTTVVRNLRIIAHILGRPQEPRPDSHTRYWRRSQT